MTAETIYIIEIDGTPVYQCTELLSAVRLANRYQRPGTRVHLRRIGPPTLRQAELPAKIKI